GKARRGIHRQVRELEQQGLVHMQGGHALDRTQPQRQVDLAAGHARRDPFAPLRLQRAQLVGRAEADLEEAVVDRAELAGERPPRGCALAGGVGGHAADHAGIRWFGEPMVNSHAIPAVSDMSQSPRPSGRAPDQMREVRIERGFTRHAEGSVLVAFGDTRVLCTASVENRVPGFLRGKGSGWVTAEYGMLPRATNTRTDREA